MASNEVELFGEVSTGSLLPGGSAGLRIKRTWQSRQASFISVVLQQVGTGSDDLEESVAGDERLGDLYLGSLERAVRTSDGFYREALARLVAGAIDGSTPIDIAEALADRILRLDVASLRLMYAIYRRSGVDPILPSSLTFDTSVAAALREYSAERSDLVDPSLAQLEAAGFVKREVHVDTTSEHGREPESEVETVFERTAWGVEAYQLCRLHEGPAS